MKRERKTNREVLVVDDEPGIREVFEQALNLHGFSAISAASGEEALEILKDRNIMVMFLDLKLPGMDGFELCKQIRMRNRVAFIFAMTGYVALFELSDCREVGFDDYFIKPFTIRSLLQTTREAFRKLDRWKKDGSLLHGLEFEDLKTT
jgi:DNA-binding response OmpR family regulator